MATRKKPWKEPFLLALSRMGNVWAASQAVGINRATAFKERHKDPAFAEAWEEALQDAADVLEREAFRRALQGVDEPVVHQGRIMTREEIDINTGAVRDVPVTVKRYSDTLLIFLLKGARPDKFRDQRVELTGKGGGPIKVEHSEEEVREGLAQKLRLVAGD